MKGLIGKKVGMTQVYDENGVLIPVTVIEAGPCVVTEGGADRRQAAVGAARSAHLRKGRGPGARH